MNVHSLPPYRGQLDTPRWGTEPDRHGKLPSLRVRDYVVLLLIFAFCVPTPQLMIVRFWFLKRKAESWNSTREMELGIKKK